MPDTQWPKYEVFQQEREGQPHRNVGSVHAPDAEMALQNAKDVFVRRPHCLSLWVVPCNLILARSSQELVDGVWTETAPTIPSPAGPELYYVCQKQNQKPSDAYVVHVGQVEATGPVEALRRGLEQFGEDSAWVWWVFPARAVTSSEPEDIESMFDPALEKHYRHQYHYHTVAGMRKIKEGH
jgi:phenylacetate-CoA oxygenase PaaH subunit